jgi:hypothetical protein
MRNRWISATLWGAAVVLAVGGGTAAVAAASTGTGRHVLSQHDVDRELGAAPSTSPSPAPIAASSNASDNSQVVRVSAGTVVVTCEGDTARLLRWTPKTGYRADDPTYGPAAVISVRFESDTADDVTVTVRCVAGKAVASTTVDADDHGHDGNGGNPATPSPTVKGDDHGGDNHGGGGPGRGGSDDPTGDDHGGGGHGSDDPIGHQ